MAQYWVAIYRPNGYNPATEDSDMADNISALNRDMVAAGIRVFVGGLQSPATAQSIVLPDPAEANAEPQIRLGPYLQAHEYVGGFWVLEVAMLDEALHWGRKAALACRAAVEVRPFH
jgi:hypothetical protein